MKLFCKVKAPILYHLFGYKLIKSPKEIIFVLFIFLLIAITQCTKSRWLTQCTKFPPVESKNLYLAAKWMAPIDRRTSNFGSCWF